MTLVAVIILVVTGVVTGVLAGLLGIGGSIIMIPVMTEAVGTDYHLAQAAAMCVNALVAVPSVVKHHKKRAIHFGAAKRILPSALVGIVLGVMLSNELDHDRLKLAFGVFLVYLVYANVRKLIDNRKRGGENESLPEHVPAVACVVIGLVVGTFAGLLGIGGGIIAVALIHRFCHLPLRNSVAVSAGVMCITAPVGAVIKLSSLSGLGGQIEHTVIEVTAGNALILAGILGSTAIAFSYVGAGLTHKLPLVWIRGVLVVLLVAAAYKMLEGPIGGML